ncbi:MAG TPA: DUF3365 domain-containing protein [Nitrosomonas sp.]|nr:DUF3365 domain-containing protein [Nitrosomonas sp.]
MRFGFIMLVIALLHFSTLSVAENTAQLEEKAKHLASQLGMQLKARLITAIEADGPSNAITTCSVAAPEIAEELSKNGWKVGRTSLKLRNPDNSPDKWEGAMLLAFEQQLAAGTLASNLQGSTIESSDGVTRYRFMKAIPIDGVCLACHGETIAKDVQSILAEKYPLDAATGYKPGELRGAFTISKILDDDSLD